MYLVVAATSRFPAESLAQEKQKYVLHIHTPITREEFKSDALNHERTAVVVTAIQDSTHTWQKEVSIQELRRFQEQLGVERTEYWDQLMGILQESITLEQQDNALNDKNPRQYKKPNGDMFEIHVHEDEQTISGLFFGVRYHSGRWYWLFKTTLVPSKDPSIIPTRFQDAAEQLVHAQSRLQVLENEKNEYLQVATETRKTVEQLVKDKTRNEEIMMTRFVAVLNEKKQKYRSLKKAYDRLKDSNSSVTASTGSRQTEAADRKRKRFTTASDQDPDVTMDLDVPVNVSSNITDSETLQETTTDDDEMW